MDIDFSANLYDFYYFLLLSKSLVSFSMDLSWLNVSYLLCFRWHWNLSIGTAKAVIMALLTSGKYTSRCFVYVARDICCQLLSISEFAWVFCFVLWKAPLVAAMEYLKYTTKEDKGNIMWWYDLHNNHFIFSSPTLLFNFFFWYVCRLWTCLVQACGMFGIPQARREYKLTLFIVSAVCFIGLVF